MFIKLFSKIKPSIIAKEIKIDYSNVLNGKAKTEKIELLDKELKKKIFGALIYENLLPREKEALKEIHDLLGSYKSDVNNAFYTIDSIDVINIKILINIFEEYIKDE